jgi:hypothetical protein
MAQVLQQMEASKYGYMNFIDDLKGDAPNSTSNAFSINMTSVR